MSSCLIKAAPSGIARSFMAFIAFMAFWGCPSAIAALAMAAGPAFARSAPGPAPGNRIAKLAPLLPREILAGPMLGTTGSRLTTSPQYRALVKPTAVSRETWIAPSFGALVSARWNHGFTLSLSPRRETYGVSTREETVSFPDNPFPHTLRASTELTYNVWPLFMGMGWFRPRQHFLVQIGAYAASLAGSDVQWIVDGQPYPGTPNVKVSDSQTGWLLGTEYGFRIGPGEILLGAESQRGFDSLREGLQGSIKARSVRFHMAYAWTVMRR